MLFSDFIDCVPHSQDIIVFIDVKEFHKDCLSLKEVCVDISKYHFDNIEHVLSSELYDSYKDYYIDYVYAYKDSLCVYIRDI